MKKMLKLSISIKLLVIATLFFNCSNSKTFDKEIVNKDRALQYIKFPEFGEDTLKASYFADTVIFIPLETTSESLIGSIEHLWMNDSIIIIQSHKNPLLQFKRNGKFIKQIGKIGRGPGEYASIINFCVIQEQFIFLIQGKDHF